MGELFITTTHTLHNQTMDKGMHSRYPKTGRYKAKTKKRFVLTLRMGTAPKNQPMIH